MTVTLYNCLCDSIIPTDGLSPTNDRLLSLTEILHLIWRLITVVLPTALFLSTFFYCPNAHLYIMTCVVSSVNERFHFSLTLTDAVWLHKPRTGILDIAVLDPESFHLIIFFIFFFPYLWTVNGCFEVLISRLLVIKIHRQSFTVYLVLCVSETKSSGTHCVTKYVNDNIKNNK